MSLKIRFAISRPSFELNVDLSLPEIGITGIFGQSGSGKTTLLRAIAGLEPDSPGYLKIGDEIWQDEAQFVPTHQRAIGYVFQDPTLFPHLTIKQNLEYGLKRIPKTANKINLNAIIELLNIGHLLDRQTHQLSGGERQRITIARAIATSPKILLMDEPLSSLDRDHKQEIMPYLETLHEELQIPILYVSHSVGEIARLADQLVLIEAGKIKAFGEVTDIFTRLDLSLAKGDKAAAIIEAHVAGHDDQFNLTYLDFPGGRFSVAKKNLPINHLARLRVIARDVSITLEAQTNTSILNIFPAKIEEIIAENEAQVMVKALVGSVPILSRITRKSLKLLDLKPEKKVYLQVKTVALLT